MAGFPTAEDDILFGTDGNDTIDGLAGNDSIDGRDGDDLLIGGAGDDLIAPGPAVSGDVILGSTGNDTIDFTSADADAFYTVSYADLGGPLVASLAAGFVHKGAAGIDSLHELQQVSGMEGGLVIRGTAADDVLVGGAPGVVFVSWQPGPGADTIIGTAAATDQISYAADPIDGGVTIRCDLGYAIDPTGATDIFIGIDQAEGTQFDDLLVGALDTAEIRPGGGNDTIDGSSAIITLSYVGASSPIAVDLATGAVSHDGFGGVDILLHHSITNVQGGDASDTLTGDLGSNRLRGEGGDDSLTGGLGNDRLQGDDGDDTLIGADGADTLEGGRGNDLLIPGPNAADGSGIATPIEQIIGGIGNDTVDLAGDDLAIGQFFLSYDSLTGPVTVNLAAATVAKGANGTDTLIGLQRFAPDRSAMVVIGTAAGDTFIGSPGVGEIDWRGGAGADTILGSAAIDRISYRDEIGAKGALVDLGAGIAFDVSGAIDVFTSIEAVEGSPQNDTLFGSAGDNVIRPLDGDNVIDGRGGADLLDYGDAGVSVSVDLVTGRVVKTDWSNGDPSEPAIDTILANSIENVRGGDTGDSIDGDNGANLLQGNGGDDRLGGHSGNDTLEGGTGDDTLTDGDGDDVVDGGEGADFLNVGTGSNSVAGGGGDDQIAVGPNLVATNSTIDGAEGQDRIDLYGDLDGKLSGQFIIAGGEGNDSIESHANSYYGRGGYLSLDGFLSLDGGADDDRIGIAVDFREGRLSVNGGDGNDDIQVSIHGETGHNSFIGGAGDDTLRVGYTGTLGGDGVDTVDNDTIDGGAGNDDIELSGGPGYPLYQYNDVGGRIIVMGGEGDDTIRGISDYNHAYGRGSNFLVGALLNGGDGNDVIDVTFTHDPFVSSTADMTIVGGAGIDLMRAGPATSIFVFADGFGPIDGIFGFRQGQDKIQLAANINSSAIATPAQAAAATVSDGVNAFVIVGDEIIAIAGVPQLLASDFVIG